MVAFDTLQVAKELETAFTPEQAEVLVKAFARTLTDDLATKRDLADMETRLRGEINEVRGEIKDIKVDMVRWIVGALVVNFFGIAGLIITLIKSVAR